MCVSVYKNVKCVTGLPYIPVVKKAKSIDKGPVTGVFSRMSTEAATAISAAPASHSDSGDDLMSDFVVLSKSPQEESLLVVENPALAQLQLSLPSGDISLDEAEQCVRDLLRENRELKGKSSSTRIASGHPMVPVCSLVVSCCEWARRAFFDSDSNIESALPVYKLHSL